jgi:amino-acid N-acetyltransferase
MSATIRSASFHEWSSIRQLLESAALPTDDLDESACAYFTVYADDSEIKGAFALEPLAERYAMVRSLVVATDIRGRHVGQALLESVETQARSKQVTDLFLLTTSADGFFARAGYERIARDVAPECVRTHAQFKSLCPASAIVMRKRIQI